MEHFVLQFTWLYWRHMVILQLTRPTGREFLDETLALSVVIGDWLGLGILVSNMTIKVLSEWGRSK